MKRKTSLERSFDTVSFRDSLRMRTTSKKIKLSLTRFSKIQVYITVEYLKMTARSRSNSSGAELGHLVKVSDSLSIIITVEYLKMTARSRSNSSGAELGHLVKVSKIPFQYIPGFLKTGLAKISCFLRQKA